MYSKDTPTVKYRKDYKPSQYVITQTHLDFKLYPDYVEVFSRLIIEKNPNNQQALLPLELNGEELELLEIKVDGQKLSHSDYEIDDERLTLFKVAEKFVVETQVKIFPAKNTSLEGLYLSNGKFCTQCEAEGFRKITYYIDRPEIMSEFFVSIEADKVGYPSLLSNGNPIESKDCENNRHRAKWHDPFPKPCYLFALVAGDFDCLEDSFTTMNGREVQLKLFVDKGKLDQCDFAMESLINAMRWDEKNFAREYDLDLYMIVAVGDFNMGAMENKGLNVFNTAYVLANKKTATDDDFAGVERVIAHEYFHNWTGNRITCRDWFQLSLKEGLTVFRDQKFSQDMQSEAVERIDQVKIIRAAQFAEDSGPMAHSIRPDSYIEMNNFYTVTVYNKGAEVIRMMHTLLGKEGFRAGMDLYFKRHDGQAVTCEDFIKAMEDANSVNWSLFRNWYRQAGTPEVKVSLQTLTETTDDKTIRLEFVQSCPSTGEQKSKKPFMIPIKIGFLNSAGGSLEFRKLGDTNWQQEILFTLTSNTDNVDLEFKNPTELHSYIPSLLRDFSAPVKLKYQYTQEQLAKLFAFDVDPFNRWDAGQNLMSHLLLSDSIEAEISQPHLDAMVSSISNLLQDSRLDNALKALAIQLPNINSLIGEVETIDFDRLASRYRQLKKAIAESLTDEWANTYNRLNKLSFDQQTSGDRALKNIALYYLITADRSQYQDLAIDQLTLAENMTDEIAALRCIADSTIQNKTKYLESFYAKWQQEELVLDKWFSAQTSIDDESIFESIRALLENEKFSMTNPNKVRSVVGAFIAGNPLQFNSATGKGYEFLTEMVIKLNEVNPQVGSRMAKQFGQWKKFDASRQALIKEQLERIIQIDNLSKDIFEIVNKSLNS